MTRTPPAWDDALDELGRLYDQLAGEVSGTAVRCDLRGLCCDFDVADHVLFATDLEVEWARRHGGSPVPAAKPGSCPWFRRGTCHLREGRPLSCRVYYCDPGYAEEMSELGERYHRAVVGIHERHGVPYRYARFVETVQESGEPAPPEPSEGPEPS